jgi:hypothetical protein
LRILTKKVFDFRRAINAVAGNLGGVGWDCRVSGNSETLNKLEMFAELELMDD